VPEDRELNGADQAPEEWPGHHAAEHRRRELRRARRAEQRARWLNTLPWVLAIVFGAAAIIIGAAFVGRLKVAPVPSAQVPVGPRLLIERTFRSLDTTATQPNGVFLAGGKLYVADLVRRRVDVFTEGGSHIATIGVGVLEVPVYVAVGPVDGRLYVADRDLGTVVVFAADGKKVGFLDPSGLHPKRKRPVKWRPLGLAFAPDGTLYVADSSDEAHIAVFSAAGSRIATLGGDVPPGRIGRTLAFPNGMVVTNDEVIVADSNNGRLVYFGRDGVYRRAVTVEGIPRGIAQMPDGGLLISDAATGELRTYAPDGQPRATLKSGVRATVAMLSSPAGVAVDRDGTMFVADSGSGSIAVLEEKIVPLSGTPVRQTDPRGFALIAGLCALLAVVSVTFGYFRARKRPRNARSRYNRAQVRVGKR
jgi:DNA-binding beta-propeller fold protein YncE